jgi:hypothetical protein
VTRSETAGSLQPDSCTEIDDDIPTASDRFLRKSPEPDTIYRLREVDLATESKLNSLNLNLKGHAEYYPSTNQTITYTERRLLHILIRIMMLFDKPIHASHYFAFVHHTLQYFSTALRHTLHYFSDYVHHTLQYFFHHSLLRLSGVPLLSCTVL